MDILILIWNIIKPIFICWIIIITIIHWNAGEKKDTESDKCNNSNKEEEVND